VRKFRHCSVPVLAVAGRQQIRQQCAKFANRWLIALNQLRRQPRFVGRVLLALLFVTSGFGKLTSFAGTAGYMAAKMPMLPIPLVDALLVATIAIELGGGLLIMLGWQARLAALAIVVFLVPVTVVFHNFWAVEESQRMIQQIMFMKNLSIMGGMLLIAAFGPGPVRLGSDRCG